MPAAFCVQGRHCRGTGGLRPSGSMTGQQSPERPAPPLIFGKVSCFLCRENCQVAVGIKCNTSCRGISCLATKCHLGEGLDSIPAWLCLCDDSRGLVEGQWERWVWRWAISLGPGKVGLFADTRAPSDGMTSLFGHRESTTHHVYSIDVLFRKLPQTHNY